MGAGAHPKAGRNYERVTGAVSVHNRLRVRIFDMQLKKFPFRDQVGGYFDMVGGERVFRCKLDGNPYISQSGCPLRTMFSLGIMWKYGRLGAFRINGRTCIVSRYYVGIPAPRGIPVSRSEGPSMGFYMVWYSAGVARDEANTCPFQRSALSCGQ